MPRKQRAAKHRRGDLSPSMRHYLMVGCPSDGHLAPVRLSGWLDLLNADDGETLAAWKQHRAELIREAASAGFEPFGAVLEREGGDVDDVLPPDPAREAWSRAFCDQWGY